MGYKEDISFSSLPEATGTADDDIMMITQGGVSKQVPVKEVGAIGAGKNVTLNGLRGFGIAMSTTELRMFIPFSQRITASGVRILSGQYAARGGGKSTGYQEFDLPGTASSTAAVASDGSGVQITMTRTSASSSLVANTFMGIQLSNVELSFS